MDGVVERPDFRQEAFFYPFSICVNWISLKMRRRQKEETPKKMKALLVLVFADLNLWWIEERLAFF